MASDTRASDWKVRWDGDIQVLGVTHQVFIFKSQTANTRKRISFIGYGKPLGAHATTGGRETDWTSLGCKKSFSVDDLDETDGEIMGVTGGFLLNIGVILISASKLFSMQRLIGVRLGVGSSAFYARGEWST